MLINPHSLNFTVTLMKLKSRSRAIGDLKHKTPLQFLRAPTPRRTFRSAVWLCLCCSSTCGCMEIPRWHGQFDEVYKSFWHRISAISWTVKEAPVIKIHSETQLEDCSFSKTNVMHSFCLGSFSSLSHSLWTRVIKQAWCRPIIFTLKAINQDWLRKWRQLSKISYVTRVRLK